MLNEEKDQWPIFSPTTIGRLKQAIANMDDDIPVFRLEVGNIEGVYEWKRHQTWKQWVREQEMKK